MFHHHATLASPFETPVGLAVANYVP